MSTPQIRVVTSPEDVAEVSNLLTITFDEQDPNRWLIPDPARRLLGMREFFAVLTEQAAAGGGWVLMTEDGLAAAVVFDRFKDQPVPADADERIAAATGPWLERFGQLDEEFEKVHPTEDHLHLAFIVVKPGYQGHGLGGALLDYVHDVLGEGKRDMYLESTSSRNQKLYESYGYQVMDPAFIDVGDPSQNRPGQTAGARFTRMWRPAA